MKKIIEFINKNFGIIKTIAIIALAVFLLSSGVLNWLQDKWNTELTEQNVFLENQKVQLEGTIKNLHTIQEQAQVEITELKRMSDSIETAYELRGVEMALKDKRHQKELEELKAIPKDTVYITLQEINPDPYGVKEYPFTEFQIRRMYSTYVKLDYQIGLNSDLNSQITTLGFNLRTKDNIIKNKNVQLGALQTEVAVSHTYTNNLEENNEALKRSRRSERRWRKVFMYASVGELVYIAIDVITDNLR